MIEIRELKIEELEKCLNLFNEEYADYTLSNYPELQEIFLKESSSKNKVEEIKNNLKNGSMIGRTANIENELVGFILIEKPNYIRKLVVDYKYQNKDIAKKLINTIGQKDVYVHAAEKVIPFYEKCGFFADGEMNRDKYPYLPMKRINLILPA